jgi:glycosyltransferase 2 family protein
MPRHKFGLRGVLRVILWATGLGLLGHVLWTNRFSAREVLAHRADGSYLVLAFALCLTGLVSTFVRWCILVRVQGLTLRFRDAVRVGFVGNAVDLIVPGQVGGDVVKAAFLYRTQERRTRAVASILIDRAVGILGLFVLAGVMGAVNWSDSGAEVRRLIVVVWGAVLAGTLGLVAALSPALIRPFDRLATRHGRIRSLIAELHAVSQTYRDRKAGVLLGVAMSTCSHALYALSFAAVSAALVPHPPSFAQHLQMVPLVLFTTVVPLPFGALGLSEQVSDSLFRMLGHPMGALVMLGFRLVSLAVGCISITVYMTSGREVPKAAREGHIVG